MRAILFAVTLLLALPSAGWAQLLQTMQLFEARCAQCHAPKADEMRALSDPTVLAVRTKTHKCTFELASGAGELYDLVNDPAEMQNRFDDPDYSPIRRELYDMMRARPGTVLERLAEPVGMA